ncbi:sensory box sensor histidine kinase/response regulator [Rhodobacteraceae bacterium KLH11]|nr:sensory box sensor histidine kinase/response regulator [Rhodobacteraceae bacterium KLH11]
MDNPISQRSLWPCTIGEKEEKPDLGKPPKIPLDDATDQHRSLLMQQITDYCQVGKDLLWHRLLIFASALVLAAYYYSAPLAKFILLFVVISEICDYWLFNRILKSKEVSTQAARRFLPHLYLSAFLSTFTIIAYSVGIVVVTGPTNHFVPLFFLFAAALFSAMNSHYIKQVLTFRLVCLGIAFLFIPVRDIVIMEAPLQSELWAQLFISIFALYFIVESARGYLSVYRAQLAQMELLRKEHEKSRAAYKAKSEFVSTMSHELRTPLTSIKGSVDLAQSGKLGKTSKNVSAALKMAQRNCDRLLKLIDQILDFQSAESGQMTFERQRFDLVELITDTFSSVRPSASEKGISLRSEFPDREVEITGDKQRLQQVIDNILTNAINFSPKDSDIVVFLQTDNGKVRILFRDTGIGLSESDEARVFDPFTQLDSSDSRSIGGTGLGLSVSRQIVEAHGGTITYHKNSDTGTTFVVELGILPSC